MGLHGWCNPMLSFIGYVFLHSHLSHRAKHKCRRYKTQTQQGLFCRPLCPCEQFIHHEGYGTVARDVAGGSEAVHRDVEGNHEGLHVGIKAQDRGQRRQGCHDTTTGHAGGLIFANKGSFILFRFITLLSCFFADKSTIFSTTRQAFLCFSLFAGVQN